MSARDYLAGITELRRAADILRAGGLVAMPTETVYGLAANAFDPRAVARVFEAKNRPFFDPLIVHIADLADLHLIAREVPPAAEPLMRAFWPGPLTMVFPKRESVPDLITSGLPTVAVRMPGHPLALELIRTAGTPLAAPSANPFGSISPTTADHVRSQLGDKVDMVLDGGPCAVGVESTIIGWQGDEPALLRAGGISIEEIESFVGPVRLRSSLAGANAPEAPGQCERHYAPRTPLRLLRPGERPPAAGERERVGWLGLEAPPRNAGDYALVEALSPRGDLREAAAALFAAMHRLDASGLSEIHACTVPDEGLGLAINDRLRRAAAPANAKPSISD